MKTAISLPDDLFDKAEKLARRLKKSRSQFYREAVADLVARYDEQAMIEAINRAYQSPDPETDGFVTEAARRNLEQTEW
jgi:metal-responsive CopG/Arc/MetJ family transcriptional regulator